MTKKIIIPYVAAILAMVVCISVAADDGAVVARSYAGYNNQKPSVASDNVYRPVNLSWNNTFKKVTAEEALGVKDGVLVFAFPQCPFCRNLIPELAEVAKKENETIYYCQVDEYRDKYEFDTFTGKPVKTQEAGDGYYELLDWLGDYLNDYAVADNNKNKIKVGEKRISAPTVIRIENGQPVSTWLLEDVEDAGYPTNAFDTWCDDTQDKVTESLRNYFEEK